MKIAPDKKKHFFVGILMGLALQAFLCFLLPSQFILSISLALILVIVISYGFEIYSKITGHGHYDFLDAVASTIGGIVGMLIFLGSRLFI